MKKLLTLLLIPAIAFAQPSGGHLNSTQDSVSCLLSGSPVETDASTPGTKGMVVGGIGQDGNFHRMFIGNNGEPLHYLYDGANGTFSVIAPSNPSTVDAGLVVRNIFPAYNNGASSASVPRFTIANDSTPIGALTETAPATDTASSGLNGRLQRIAQRLTTLIGSTLAVSVADGSNVTLGSKADAKNTATDTTAISIVSILKQISASVQAPPTQAASQSGTWTVQPGNTANTTPWLVQVVPATSGGLTKYHLVSAASTNATNVKASAGQLCGWYIYNSNAAVRKVAFHDTSGTPTAGASVYFSFPIPPGGGANTFTDHCIPFSSGIGITAVTGLADSDATAVAANDLVINLFVK